MTTNIELQRNNVSSDTLLMESIQIYKRMFDLYERFNKNFTAMTFDGSEQEMASIKTLMEKVRLVDNLTEKNLSELSSITPKTQNLIDERKNIIACLQKVNKAVANKAENAKSLIFHDISNMRSNRSAMQGYKNTEIKRSIIRNSV